MSSMTAIDLSSLNNVDQYYLCEYMYLLKVSLGQYALRNIILFVILVNDFPA